MLQSQSKSSLAAVYDAKTTSVYRPRRTKCIKMCGFDWSMMSGHQDGMNGHTHTVLLSIDFVAQLTLRPPPLMEHFVRKCSGTVPELFQLGTTSEQICSHFTSDHFGHTSEHFERYPRLL